MQVIFILFLLNGCMFKILSRDTHLLYIGVNMYIIYGIILSIISIFIVLWVFLETAVIYKILSNFLIYLQLVSILIFIYVYITKTTTYLSSEITEFLGIKVMKCKFSVLEINFAATEYASIYSVKLPENFLGELYKFCNGDPTPELVKEYILNLKHRQSLWYNVILKYICGTTSVSDISIKEVIIIVNMCITILSLGFSFYSFLHSSTRSTTEVIPDGFCRTVESRLSEHNNSIIHIYNSIRKVRAHINAETIINLGFLKESLEAVRDYIAFDDSKANIRTFRAGSATILKRVAQEVDKIVTGGRDQI